jgi:DNA-binding XRE family transcriptional regulator
MRRITRPVEEAVLARTGRWEARANSVSSKKSHFREISGLRAPKRLHNHLISRGSATTYRRSAVRTSRHKEEIRDWSNRSTPLPRLRELRRSRGLSQRALAELAGLSVGTVYRLENGLRGAYPSSVSRLASALGVSTQELVRERRRT